MGEGIWLVGKLLGTFQSRCLPPSAVFFCSSAFSMTA